MNDLLAPIRAYLDGRSLRERWLLVLGGCVAALIVVNLLAIGPLEGRATSAETDAALLERQLTRALQIASQVRSVQGELVAVERNIRPGAKVNLLSLLEKLASEATISKEQLESIKPKRPSGNPRYPETRVEVSLKGTTLGQTVDFLYRIESNPMLLIVRSLRIRNRGGPSGQVDATFTVSTFERA